MSAKHEYHISILFSFSVLHSDNVSIFLLCSNMHILKLADQISYVVYYSNSRVWGYKYITEK